MRLTSLALLAMVGALICQNARALPKGIAAKMAHQHPHHSQGSEEGDSSRQHPQPHGGHREDSEEVDEAERLSAVATNDNAEDVPDVQYPAHMTTRACPSRYTDYIEMIKNDPDMNGEWGYDVKSDKEYFHSRCIGPQPTCKSSQIPSSADRKLIVDMHNDVRAAQDAANMLEMHWDNELAETALGWATQCLWNHDRNINRDSPGRFDVGQNLALSPKKWNWKDVITFWVDEEKYWKLGKGAVKQPDGSFKMVGHFTQVVDARSYRIGCAYADCGDESAGGVGHYYACDYGAAGNVGGFASPYEEGDPVCHKDYLTADGLCDCQDAIGADKTCDMFEKFDETTCHCVSMFETQDQDEYGANLEIIDNAQECDASEFSAGGVCGPDDIGYPIDCADGDPWCCCTSEPASGGDFKAVKLGVGNACYWKYEDPFGGGGKCKDICHVDTDTEMSFLETECSG